MGRCHQFWIELKNERKGAVVICHLMVECSDLSGQGMGWCRQFWIELKSQLSRRPGQRGQRTRNRENL